MKKLILSLICLLLATHSMKAGDEALNKQIYLNKFKGTTYEALSYISTISGLLFIYDSNLINNNRKVTIEKGEMTLRQAILSATKSDGYLLKVVENHILLYKNESSSVSIQSQHKASPVTIPDSASFFIVDGVVKDRESKDPLSYASISLVKSSIGSVANQNGEFQLKIPDSLRNSSIRISYIGYTPQIIPAQLLSEVGNQADIYLESSFIPIQEVIVKMVNPEKIVREMVEKRPQNYSGKPAYFTAFYREGVDNKKGFATLTEAVFKIYKSGLKSIETDNVKLLKMRKVSNEENSDSISLKIKAGISATVNLDIIKNLPDFFVLDDQNPYHYSKIDMTEIDSSLAHVIAFEQKEGFQAPLYKGELYIHADNSALLNAHFEIDPRYIKNAKDMFVVKQAKGLDVNLKQVEYSVSYKEWEGKYYPNYIRGDLGFDVKFKKRFWRRPASIHIYFEMVVCKVDTDQVKRFPNKETIQVKNIFSDIHYLYDRDFWEGFNIIPPEEKLNKEIRKIKTKIEERIE